MNDEYLLVSSSILPKCYLRVVEAKRLLSNGIVDNVSEACKRCDISRSTFYKYQDTVFSYKQSKEKKKISFSLNLSHRPGALSSVLNRLSEKGASILTISQAEPIADKAAVLVSCDISEMDISVEELKGYIISIPEVSKFEMLSFEE